MTDASAEGHGVRGAVVGCAVYVDGERLPGEWTYRGAAAEVRRRGTGFVWLGLLEPTAEQVRSVAEVFGLPARSVRDAVAGYVRPKAARYGDVTFLVLKTARHVAHPAPGGGGEIVETGEVMAFLGNDFVITVRHGAHSSLHGLREELEASPERLALGPSAVLHAVAGHVVDSHVEVVSAFEGDIDAIEALVFAPGVLVGAEQMYLMKREVVELNRSVTPLAVVLREAVESPEVVGEVREGFRDLLDRLAVVSERIESFDQLLTSLLYATLARITLRQNDDVRKITSWAAIVALPTMVFGLYGMNFEHMPELGWEYGYHGVLGFVAVGCLVLHRTFKRNRWL
ncbi:magnesium and cobalt transport protein CorA [Umezawaea sp.]|uniref:magnesium and cobalt transport protein CorA n=1 Tax=Umezawaea sp. TaxID=1955258 RepID=UPI002ED13FC9